MRGNRPSSRARRAGFTMLELVLAMLLLTMIVGMVFGTARTSLQLGVSVVESQNEEMLHQAFFELLDGRFASMPGNARLDLSYEDTGTHHLSELTLQNVPMSFTWGGPELIANAVQIATVRRRSGYLDIVLRYYEEEILDDSESTFGSLTPAGPFAEIVLLEDVRFFEWRVLDGREMEWYYDWDLPGRLPLQVELLVAFGPTGPEMRHVFWIPPRQNPGVSARQMMQEARQTPVLPGVGEGAGGSDGSSGGTGASPPAINIPGTPGAGRPPGARPPPATE